MKVFSIAKSIIKRNIRNLKVMLIMCAMPLVIIYVLGMSFSSQIGSDIEISVYDMNISYTVIGQESGLTTGLKEVVNEFIDETSTFQKEEDKDRALDELANNMLTCFIEIDENRQTIIIYKNKFNNTQASLIENALNIYADRYNAIIEIAKINYNSLEEILQDKERRSFVKSIGLDEKAMPRAMDYYGVLMVLLFVLYGAITPLDGIVGDKENGIISRIYTSPIKKYEQFLGMLIGYVAVTCIRSFIVILVSYLAFEINWGVNPIFPFLLVVALIIAVNSLAIAISNIIKSQKVATAVAQIFIVISAFFGGAYLALEDMGSISQIGKYISVIWWGNVGIMNQIYNQDYNYMIKAFAVCAVITIISLAFSIICLNQKKEKVHG